MGWDIDFHNFLASGTHDATVCQSLTQSGNERLNYSTNFHGEGFQEAMLYRLFLSVGRWVNHWRRLAYAEKETL